MFRSWFSLGVPEMLNAAFPLFIGAVGGVVGGAVGNCQEEHDAGKEGVGAWLIGGAWEGATQYASLARSILPRILGQAAGGAARSLCMSRTNLCHAECYDNPSPLSPRASSATNKQVPVRRVPIQALSQNGRWQW